jgi:hypothetical protein
MRSHRRQRNPLWFLLAGGLTTLILGFTLAQLVVGAQARNPYASYPPAKRAMLERVAQTREATLNKPIPSKNPHYVPPRGTPTTVQVWRSGISAGGPVPFSGADYQITNQWQELVDGMHVSVYAGAEGQDPAQGVLVVFATASNFSTQTAHTWLAPAHAGALRITAAHGHVLTLASASGTQFTFAATPACGMQRPAPTGDACQFVPVSGGK